jgi:hypothetical protein
MALQVVFFLHKFFKISASFKAFLCISAIFPNCLQLLSKQLKLKSGKNTTIHRVLVIHSENLRIDLEGVYGRYTVLRIDFRYDPYDFRSKVYVFMMCLKYFFEC